MDPNDLLNMVNPDQYGPNAQPTPQLPPGVKSDSAEAIAVVYGMLSASDQEKVYAAVTTNGAGGSHFMRDRLIAAGVGIVVGAVGAYLLRKR